MPRNRKYDSKLINIELYTEEKKTLKIACRYPIYLASKISLGVERKLCEDDCVGSPTHKDMPYVPVTLGLKIGVANNLHPNEQSKEVLYEGKTSVQLENNADRSAMMKDSSKGHR